MKTVLISFIAILLGCLLGVGSTAARFGFLPGVGHTNSGAEVPALPLPPDGARAVLVIDAVEYDFGTMERNAKSQHIFLVRNTGDAPLVLANGGSTCKCTILGGLEEEEAVIGPGESRDVVLEWTAKTASDEFRQTATIRTNDPLRPSVVLSVQGRVADSIRVRPTEIVFSKVDSDRSATGSLRISSIREKQIEIVGHEFQQQDRDQETLDFFRVEVRRVDAEEIDDADVRSAIDVAIHLSPGLPIGPIDEMLIIETNIEGRELIEVPILGRVVSKVSISGRGWNEEQGQLSLGSVSAAQGLRHELNLSVRGENAADIEFTVGKISTDTVHVSFGKPAILGGGRLVRLPLIVEVPAGGRIVNFMGGADNPPAEVTLHSTHPKAPKLRMLIRFAIEP